MSISTLFITLTILFFSIVPASAQTKFQEKKVGKVFYVQAPNYMTLTRELNDVAELQYLNKIREAYFIVVQDSKENMELAGSKFADLDEFYENFKASFGEGLKDLSFGTVSSVKINGMPAKQVEVTGKLEENDIWYLITISESPTHFYKMLAWSLAENRAKLIDDYKKIASSLHE